MIPILRQMPFAAARLRVFSPPMASLVAAHPHVAVLAPRAFSSVGASSAAAVRAPLPDINYAEFGVRPLKATKRRLASPALQVMHDEFSVTKTELKNVEFVPDAPNIPYETLRHMREFTKLPKYSYSWDTWLFSPDAHRLQEVESYNFLLWLHYLRVKLVGWNSTDLRRVRWLLNSMDIDKTMKIDNPPDPKGWHSKPIIEPTDETYAILMMFFCYGARTQPEYLDEVLHIVKEMKYKRVFLGRSHMMPLLSMLARTFKPVVAELFFDHMVDTCKVNPGKPAYHEIIQAHVKHGDSHAALRWIKKLQAYEVDEDARVAEAHKDLDFYWWRKQTRDAEAHSRTLRSRRQQAMVAYRRHLLDADHFHTRELHEWPKLNLVQLIRERQRQFGDWGPVGHLEELTEEDEHMIPLRHASKPDYNWQDSKLYFRPSPDARDGATVFPWWEDNKPGSVGEQENRIFQYGDTPPSDPNTEEEPRDADELEEEIFKEDRYDKFSGLFGENFPASEEECLYY